MSSSSSTSIATAAALLQRQAPVYEQIWINSPALPLYRLSRRLDILQTMGEKLAARESRRKITIKVAEAAYVNTKSRWRLRFRMQPFETPLFMALFPDAIHAYLGASQINFDQNVPYNKDVVGDTIDDCVEAVESLGTSVAKLPFSEQGQWSDVGLEPPPFDQLWAAFSTVNDRGFANARFSTWSSETRSELFTEVALAAYGELASGKQCIVKCSKARWRPKLGQWGLWWTNCVPSPGQDLLLVGYLPHELRIWKFDPHIGNRDKLNRVKARLEKEDFSLAHSPGELVASLPI